MGEETWAKNIPRSQHLGLIVDGHVVDAVNGGHLADLGVVLVTDGPRVIVCADCGTPVHDGKVMHIKPETYAITYHGEEFYLERHIGIICGCAKKRGLSS